MTNGPKRTWTDEQLVDAVRGSDSIRGVLRYLKLKGAGANYRTIVRHIRRLGLDVSQWMGKGHLKGKSAVWSVKPLDSILVENSGYAGGTSALKKRMMRKGLLKNECAVCGQGPEWNGKALMMILDHINGVNNDNRIENLRTLCPNCNSQQDTFAGRNRKLGRIQQEDCVCSGCGQMFKNKRRTSTCRHCRPQKSSRDSLCPVCGGWKSENAVMCRVCRKSHLITKVNRPSYGELKEMMGVMSMCAIGRKYGVSDNAARKWVLSYERAIDGQVM